MKTRCFRPGTGTRQPETGTGTRQPEKFVITTEKKLMNKKPPLKVNYVAYINSQEWKRKHPKWLKQANHRCMLFPWIRIGYVDGKYYSYAIHHKDREAYENLGKEKLGEDVLALSEFAHNWVFHFLLSGGKRRVKEQKVFPNFWQSIANAICEFNFGIFGR